jgi:hypothetical protein
VQIVKCGPALHRAAIVPHDEIVDLPTVDVDELRGGRIGDERVYKRPSDDGVPRMRPAWQASSSI